MNYQHTPVMLKEVMECLDPAPGNKFIDATLGGGGYSEAILERLKGRGQLLAIDLDETAIANAEKKFQKEIKNKNIIISHENFKNLQTIVEENFPEEVRFDGIAFDLGLSSAQLADRNRGFSFSLASPLGMNFGEKVPNRAEDIINSWSAAELTEIFKNYGEERFASSIARAIERERKIRKITDSKRLSEIVAGAIPKKFSKTSKIHPATKVFQALRIAVNDELENLSKALPQAIKLLKPGGKIVVISYHSLEDRIVKRFFKEQAMDCLCPPAAPICGCGGKQAKIKIITKKALRPSEEEVLTNPRARSAKLRAAEKIHPGK